MLSFQVAGLIEDVDKEITVNNAFIAAIELFAGPLEHISANLVSLGTNTNHAAYGNQLYSVLASFKDLKSSISPRRFYADLEIIQASLHHFKNQLTDPSDYVESLASDVDGFASMFDTYLANPDAVNAAPISIAAPRLAQRFRDFKDSLHLFNSMIQKLPPQQDDDSMLSIVLSGPLDLREFIARLAAIESMYSELCQLLNISEIDFPLEIAKIESGSLLAKVAGSAVVISLMTSFIQNTATYMYESYTVEGRIKTIPTRVESLDKVIDLTMKLKEAGVDTSEMESNVAKSAHTIAKDLNTLIEGQPSIVLNGLEITGTSEESKRQISFKNVPRLSGKTGI